MKNIDSVISSLISQRVETALRPHLEMLERLSAFMGVPAKGKVGRPVGSRNAVRRAVAHKPGFTPAHGGKAADFQVGEEVMYQQGRGTFVARVVRIDEGSNTVTVQAEGKKQRARPASKLYEVTA